MTLDRRSFLSGALLSRSLLPGLAALPFGVATARAQTRRPFITLGSTTTTENSGLLSFLIERFSAANAIEVRVVVAGTGKILRLAEAGDLDLALVHDRVGEDAFVASGFGAYRRDVMYNDFLIVGPASDPAGLSDEQTPAATPLDALARIAAAQATFFSRGDDSGTHRRERMLWAEASLLPTGDWYRETGAGMGATLNIAVASGGYTLVDRGTWAAFGDRGELAVLHEGGDALINGYGVILPAPKERSFLKTAEAETFIDWLTGMEGQTAIAAFRIAGEQVFFPASAPTE